MAKPSSIKLAYAAGLFDGEGCVTIAVRRILKDGTHTNTPRVSISMTNKEPLVRFQEATLGLGKPVKGPYSPPSYKKNWGKFYVYQINGFEQVQAIMGMLWNWLSEEKRLQFKRVLYEN